MLPSRLNPFPERPFVVCERVRDDDTVERASRASDRVRLLAYVVTAVRENSLYYDDVVFIRSVLRHGAASPAIQVDARLIDVVDIVVVLPVVYWHHYVDGVQCS